MLSIFNGDPQNGILLFHAHKFEQLVIHMLHYAIHMGGINFYICLIGHSTCINPSISFKTFQDIIVGEACAKLRHQLEISYPITNGIVQDWDDMNRVWDHMIHDVLKVCTHYFEKTSLLSSSWNLL